MACHIIALLWRSRLYGAGDVISVMELDGCCPTPHNPPSEVRRNCMSATSALQCLCCTTPAARRLRDLSSHF